MRRWSNYGVVVSLIFLTICLFAVSIALIYFCYQLAGGKDSSVLGGVIGAGGSIIGGGMTLIGVKYTINHARRKDFVDRFPEQLLISRKI